MDKRAYFYSGPSLKLAAVLHIPTGREGENGTLPGIVLCNGPGGYGITELTNNDPLMISVGKWLVESGYIVLRFYYRGVGESEGPAYRLIPMEQVEDIRNAITFLQSQPEVDPIRIGLFGAATGGAHASYVAAIDKRVKCIVSVNGMGNCLRWLQSMRSKDEWTDLLHRVGEDSRIRVTTGRTQAVNIDLVILTNKESRLSVEATFRDNPFLAKNLLSIESVAAMLDYHPEDVVDRISPAASFWIGALGDTTVPNEESQVMYMKAKEPKKLELVSGETHSGLYRGTGLDKVMHFSVEWFDIFLK